MSETPGISAVRFYKNPSKPTRFNQSCVRYSVDKLIERLTRDLRKEFLKKHYKWTYDGEFVKNDFFEKDYSYLLTACSKKEDRKLECEGR